MNFARQYQLKDHEKRKRVLDNLEEKDFQTTDIRVAADSIKVPTVYIAGPMSGYPEFNFPAFFSAQARLEGQGWKVFNPAAKDVEAQVHEMEAFANGDAIKSIKEGFNAREAFMWDCDKVINGDGIYMLRGWEFSPGAAAEHAVAKFIKKNYPDYQIMYEG